MPETEGEDIFDVHGTVHRQCIPLSITNEMQRCTIIFIAVSALPVSGGFSAHHQELKLYTVWAPDDGRKNRLKHVEH